MRRIARLAGILGGAFFPWASAPPPEADSRAALLDAYARLLDAQTSTGELGEIDECDDARTEPQPAATTIGRVAHLEDE